MLLMGSSPVREGNRGNCSQGPMAVLPVLWLAVVGDVGTCGMLISWATAPRCTRLVFLLGSTLARRTLTCHATPDWWYVQFDC